MNAYTIDLTTGEATQQSAGSRGAATDDGYFVDPTALEDPAVRRALGDIYQALRERRFARPIDDATTRGTTSEPPVK